MEKEILISVSPYVQKYYFNEEYSDLPESIREEVLAKLSVIAEKTSCIMSLGFHENGEIFIEERHEDPLVYDDIGAALEIKKMQTEEFELLKSLKMWYMIYRTENGKIIREIVILQSGKKGYEEIVRIIGEKYGAAGKEFAVQMLAE